MGAQPTAAASQTEVEPAASVDASARPGVTPEGKKSRWTDALPAIVGLVLFLAALEVLRVELRTVSWTDLIADVGRVPRGALVLAITLTVLNYVVLTGYDLVAFLYIGKTLPRARVMGTSFLAYAIANNVSFAMLSGASVRYRFYTRRGVTAEELSRIVFSYSVTFWLGLFALGGLSLIVSPVPNAQELPGHQILSIAGAVLLSAPPAYVVATIVRRTPFRIGRFELPLPSTGIAIAQIVISAVDWALAGAVLYVLMPPLPLSFLQFLGIFLIAILLGMISHVPGGVGVFEGLMIVLLRPYLTSAQLLPALVVFRTVYYLLPLAVALIGLAMDELWQRRTHVVRAGAVLGRVTERLTPTVLAIVTFLSGVVLLFSGATPAATGRLELLAAFLPLG